VPDLVADVAALTRAASAPNVKLPGDGSHYVGAMTSPETATAPRWTSETARSLFWTFAALGVPIMVVAWAWFGFSFEEEMSEQCKAVSAGSTMEGTGTILGTVPLVAAATMGLVTLAALALRYRAHKRTGLLLVACLVTAAIAIGIIPAQLLYTGQLFEMGAAAADCVAP
jgi:hypothetical protein